MKRTHRRRKCGQSTCNPRAPTKISAPMEPRLACERFCDHGRRHTLHRRSIPAPGSRIRAIPSAHPSRRNGLPRHRVVAFGGKTADQAPRPPPTGPQGGRRGLVIALHRRHWRGRAFRLRPQPERPPGCRPRGGPRSLPFRSTQHSDTVCATGRAKEGDAGSGACGS
jgi:hypothetical protein